MSNPCSMPLQSYEGMSAILDASARALKQPRLMRTISQPSTPPPRPSQPSPIILQELLRLTKRAHRQHDYLATCRRPYLDPSRVFSLHGGAPYYRPRVSPPEVLGYWFPPYGKGPVGNDT